jgi:simple sugar transport system permease protein
VSTHRLGPVVLERRPEPSRWTIVGVRVGAVILALLVGSVVFASTDLSALQGYRTMWTGAFGSGNALAETLVAATPLLLTGLAVAIAGRMLLWNIGAEGQFYMGAVFASWFALEFPDWPRPLLLIAMVLAGALGGALWALGPGLLRAKLAVNEIITTLMLNYVAILFVDYLVHGTWRDPESLGFPLSRPFTPNATLPSFFGTRLHLGLAFALLAALVLWLVLRGTKWGYEIRVIGESQGAARYAGMPVVRNIVLVMLVSGALAGIAGMTEVSGIVHRIQPTISPGYGYTGIIVATLGGFSPFGVVLAAFLFGALQVGGYTLQTVGVTRSVVGVLQGAILFIALGAEVLARYRVHWESKRARSGHADREPALAEDAVPGEAMEGTR